MHTRWPQNSEEQNYFGIMYHVFIICIYNILRSEMLYNDNKVIINTNS